MMPIGSRHVVCARVMASRNSAADSSSQCTDSLLCTADDCAEPVEAQSMLMLSNKDLYTCSPVMTFEHIVSLVGHEGRMRGALLAVSSCPSRRCEKPSSPALSRSTFPN